MKFLIVVEKTDTGFSAYSPDLPGCVATGRTRAVAVKRMQQAVAFHLDGMREEGIALPRPSSSSTYVDVAA